MPRFNLVAILTFIATGLSELAEGPQPVLQKTVAALFTQRSDVIYPSACRWFQASPRQSKMCRNEPGLAGVISAAGVQAVTACEDNFRYDRWNCSILLNNKAKRNIFNNVFRETALVHALVAASITHAVARSCASGALWKCACARGRNPGETRRQWKRGGCGDDLKHGRRITNNFLEVKRAGNDHIADVLKHDIGVGIEAVTGHMREVCKCHGFSGSCTTKTCWRRVGSFNSTMAALKKQYHHAVRKKLLNYTSKRAIDPKKRQRLRKEPRSRLMYLQKSPNMCPSTRGRRCRDPDNCATLCCGRGYDTRSETVENRCRCHMLSCCFVQCDVCKQQLDTHNCK